MTGIVCFDHPLSDFSLAQSNDANGADAIRVVVGKLFELYQQKDLDNLISFGSCSARVRIITYSPFYFSRAIHANNLL